MPREGPSVLNEHCATRAYFSGFEVLSTAVEIVPRPEGAQRRSSMYMMVSLTEKGFDWDDANQQHIARHKVTPSECEEALSNSQSFLHRTRRPSFKRRSTEGSIREDRFWKDSTSRVH